jgi:hypothetical protein
MIPKSGYPGQCFSNNWISFHENGDAALYPMFAITAVQNVRRNFGYVRGKGLKQKTL